MSVILIAVLGVALVLLLILVARVHPLLSLLIGSLFLLAATPADLLLKSQIAESKLTVRGTTGNGLIGLDSVASSEEYVLIQTGLSVEQWPSVRLISARGPSLQQAEQTVDLSSSSLVWYEVQGDGVTISPNAQLVPKAEVEAAQSNRWTGLGTRLNDGFTKTFRKLGIPVTMAAVVGVCLLQSGAATRLIAAIMSLFGSRGTAPALTTSGFILGIPVFFDNVFYLLLPLAKAVGRMHPEKFLTAVMAIIVGATMAHSLVPPTPGPLFVAEQMNVSVGQMMIGGFIVGGISACFGFIYGSLCNRWVHLSPEDVQDSHAVADHSEHKIPLWFAALPIALPILLLGGSEVVEFLAEGQQATSQISKIHHWVSIVNDPSLIFIGAALVAIILLRKYSDSSTVGKSVAKGLSDAGVIVLLTSAGGAFGSALQQLDLADALGQRFSSLSTPWGLLFTAFFLTAIIRVAQGSATVAMLTSSAIVAPVVESVALPFHPIYVALAIGCGSKPLPWMNDSGFWQVTTMTGMTPGQTLRTFSVALTIMGFVGFSITLLGAWLLPLVE